MGDYRPKASSPYVDELGDDAYNASDSRMYIKHSLHLFRNELKTIIMNDYFLIVNAASIIPNYIYIYF